MRLLVGLLAAITALSLVACDVDKISRRFMPPEALSVSDQAVEFFIARDAAGLRSISTRELQAQSTDAAWAQVFERRGDSNVKAIAIVGAEVTTNTQTGTSATVNYSVELSDRKLFLTIVMTKVDEKFLLHGMNVNVANPGPAGVPGLSFEKKSAAHYLVLVICIAIPIFILATLINCLRTKKVKRRILWSIFILFGIGNLAFNWTTGEFRLTLLQFQVLGAGVEILSDWVFEFGFPLGAVLWWLNGRNAAVRDIAPKT